MMRRKRKKKNNNKKKKNDKKKKKSRLKSLNRVGRWAEFIGADDCAGLVWPGSFIAPGAGQCCCLGLVPPRQLGLGHL
jgi:hypothetical protein